MAQEQHKVTEREMIKIIDAAAAKREREQEQDHISRCEGCRRVTQSHDLQRVRLIPKDGDSAVLLCGDCTSSFAAEAHARRQSFWTRGQLRAIPAIAARRGDARQDL